MHTLALKLGIQNTSYRLLKKQLKWLIFKKKRKAISTEKEFDTLTLHILLIIAFS